MDAQCNAVTAACTSIPLTPFGMRRKSSRPTNFCVLLNTAWSVPTSCSTPPARPSFSAVWCSLGKQASNRRSEQAAVEGRGTYVESWVGLHCPRFLPSQHTPPHTHSLAADGRAHDVLRRSTKVWVPKPALILRQRRGHRLTHHPHAALPAGGGGNWSEREREREREGAEHYLGIVPPLPLPPCTHMQTPTPSCASTPTRPRPHLPRPHLARATSSIAPRLITCTTYSGVPTNSASRIARPVASSSSSAGRDSACPSGPVTPLSNTRCWPSATASPFSACTCHAVGRQAGRQVWE